MSPECPHVQILFNSSALGSPKHDQDSLVLGDAVVPGWLTMLRSAEPILRILNPSTYRGILSPLFAYGKERWRVLYDDVRCTDSSLMADLQEFINKSCTEPELVPIYNDVIDHLRNVLSRLGLHTSGRFGQDRQAPSPASSVPASAPQTASTLEAWDIFVWQWDAAKDLVPLLRGPTPRQEAMIVYAHYLVMFKKLESQWWLEGWAAHIMERIWASLDDEFQIWVQWPIQEIGWVPPYN